MLLRLGGRRSGLGGRGGQQQLDAVAAGIEQLAIVLHLAEAGGDPGEGRIRLRGRDGALADEDLPQRNQRLERTRHVRAEHRIADLGDRFRGVEELEDGLVAQGAGFREDRVLAAVVAVFAGQAVHGLRRRAACRGSRSRSLTAMKIFSGSFSTALRHSAKSASSTSSGSFQVVARRVSLPSYLPCGWLTKRFFQTSRLPGMCGLPFGVDAQPRGQQHHVGVRAEHRARRTGSGDASADRGVETLHARRDRSGSPAPVRECGRARRTGWRASRRPCIMSLSKNSGPLSGGAPASSAHAAAERWPPGNHGFAAADFEHAAEEVEDVREDFEARERDGGLASRRRSRGRAWRVPGTAGKATDRR